MDGAVAWTERQQLKEGKMGETFFSSLAGGTALNLVYHILSRPSLSLMTLLRTRRFSNIILAAV